MSAFDKVVGQLGVIVFAKGIQFTELISGYFPTDVSMDNDQWSEEVINIKWVINVEVGGVYFHGIEIKSLNALFSIVTFAGILNART